MTHKYFEKSDAGLFATVKLMNKRKLLLKNLLRMGDTLNHAIFTLEQINNGLSRLESENYIEFVGNKIYITEKAKRLINSNRKGIFEPCIEELYRYSNLFETIQLQNEVVYKEYFSEEDYKKALHLLAID